MKILITNYYFNERSGSEILTLDLAKRLLARGHQVTVLCVTKGELSVEAISSGIRVTDDIGDIIKVKFDIIHSHHNVLTYIVRSFFPKTPIIFYSQGILPALEQPPSIDLGISKYIALSEEVAKNLENKGVDKKLIKILRNSIDTKFFKPKSKINKKIRKVLILSNHFNDTFKKITESTLRGLGLKYTHVGLPENVVCDVPAEINKSDLVISLGRGTLEAMACGRNTIVYDIHGADGFIDLESYKEIRKNNFSGRRYSNIYNREDLKNEILKYDPEIGGELRKIVLKNHNLDILVDNLITIYREAIKNNNREVGGVGTIPQNEILFLLKEAIQKFKMIGYQNDLQANIKEMQKKIHEVDNIEKKYEEKIAKLKSELLEIKNSRVWKVRNRAARLMGKKEIL